MCYIWAILAGASAGLAFGYLGAGGAVVTLPFALYLADMPAHDALGSKAIGVALIAGALMLWRLIRGDIRLRLALGLAVPGLAGVYGGFQLGELLPGRLLVFVLGALLVAVAAWVAYASTLSDKGKCEQAQNSRGTARPLWIVCASGAVLGFAAGFLGIAGGFLVVPA